MSTHLDPGDAHEREEAATLLVVLPRHFDLATTELVDILGSACATKWVSEDATPERTGQESAPVSLASVSSSFASWRFEKRFLSCRLDERTSAG